MLNPDELIGQKKYHDEKKEIQQSSCNAQII